MSGLAACGYYFLTPMLIAGLLFLRGESFAHYSLWYDEAFSWQMTQFSWPEMMERLRLDVHPPLYYLLLKAWTGIFGDSVASLRGYSLVCFGGALLGAQALAHAAMDPGVSKHRRALAGWLGLSLLGTNELLFRFSMEARMYAQGLALFLWSSACLLWMVNSRRPRLAAIAYSVTSLAMMYTHYVAFFAVGTQLAFALVVTFFRLRRSGWRDWQSFRLTVGAMVFVSMGYLPWLGTFLWQCARVRQIYWASPINSSSPLSLNLWREVLHHLLVNGARADISARRLAPIWSWLEMAFLGGVALSLARSKQPGKLLLFLLMLVPSTLLVANCYVQGRMLVLTRYLLLPQAAVLVGAGVTLASARHRFRWIILLALFFPLQATWRLREELRSSESRQFALLAEKLDRELQPGDRVLALDVMSYFPLKHYLVAREQLRYLSESSASLHYLGEAILQEKEKVSPHELAIAGTGRLWLIGQAHDFRKASLPSMWRRRGVTSYPATMPAGVRATLTEWHNGF